MADFNQVILMGRLTADPELRYTTSGTAVAKFTVAVNDPQSKEARDRGDKPKVNFLDCVAWRGLAENLANYQKKGSLVLVSGRLTKRSYDAQDGTKRYVTEVVAEKVQFMPKSGSGNGGNGNNGSNGGNGGGNWDSPGGYDEIPF